MKKNLYFLILLSFFIQNKALADDIYTLFFTNDEHSRLLGFAPNSEYEPNKLGDGTIGGAARVATLLKERRAYAKKVGPVLTLEGGDFSMGTLFQTYSREKGAEIQLFDLLDYDTITIGNHEFDFGVKGLTQMIRAAKKARGKIPPIVATNLTTTQNQKEDLGLREFYKAETLKKYHIIEKQGLRFGILGLLGKDAIEVTVNNYKPLTFAEPIESIKTWVKELKKEKVDVIIVLSHSGVARPDPNWKGTEYLEEGDDGKWFGEDIDLAKAVPEIDVIISGHTHTPLAEPLRVGKTLIVQAGSEFRYLGEMEVRRKKDKNLVGSYRLHPIDDKILGDKAITKFIEELKEDINEHILQPLQTSFDTPTAIAYDNATRNYEDKSLASILTQGFQEAANADIGFCPDGIIRDDIFKGKTGIQSFSDIYRLMPLGFGETEESVGYPMIKVHINGKELKEVLETLLLAYKFKGSNYHPRLSGISLKYNPYRPPLDQIMEVSLVNKAGHMQSIDLKDTQKLYSVGTISYVGKFFWIIPEVSMGIFNVTPKFSNGKPIENIRDAVVRETNGKEYKGWKATYDYIIKLPKDPKTKLPLIPTDPEFLKSNMIEVPSLSPSDYFQNATWVLWTSCFALPLLLVLSMLFMRFLIRRFKRS